MNARLANAVVEYVEAATGAVVDRREFYDPGLDDGSEYARLEKRHGRWTGLHMAYACGRPLWMQP